MAQNGQEVMKSTLMSLAKIYMASFGLAHYEHFALFVDVDKTLIGAFSYLSSWWWHVFLLLVYLGLPIAAVVVDNYVSYVIVAGVITVGILAELFGAFVLTTNFNLLVLAVSSLGAVISFILAIEDVASKVSGEILSLKWSQF